MSCLWSTFLNSEHIVIWSCIRKIFMDIFLFIQSFVVRRCECVISHIKHSSDWDFWHMLCPLEPLILQTVMTCGCLHIFNLVFAHLCLNKDGNTVLNHMCYPTGHRPSSETQSPYDPLKLDLLSHLFPPSPEKGPPPIRFFQLCIHQQTSGFQLQTIT